MNTIRRSNGTHQVPRKSGLSLVYKSGFVALLLLWLLPIPAGAADLATPSVIVIIGAAGTPDYGSNFTRQASLWERACGEAHARNVTIGLMATAQTNDLDVVRSTLACEPKETSVPLWIVLIGHGTFDGKEARFNLRGPDISASDLALWLKPFKRPLAVIDTTSSSAPFLTQLSGTNRVIITATRSGHEQNYTRFGAYFAEALNSIDADFDKDGEVSLLEAFLSASRHVVEFYKLEGRLATEHALLDDNGDGLGTPGDWFRGTRAVKRPKENAGLDGFLARQFTLKASSADARLTLEQRARRDTLEKQVFALRESKSQMPEQEYYRKLEELMLQLAGIYKAAAR